MVRTVVLAFGFWLLAAGAVVGQEWTFSAPEKLPPSVNSEAEEGMPILSPDGRTLYFTRFMYDGNVGGRYSGQDIWVSEFEGGKWTKAENRGLSLRNDKKNNAVVGVSSDGKTVYLMDAAPNRKLKGIYFSNYENDSWSEPELIPIEGIASDGFIGFYVSPDFEVILISMKGADSRGEEDLYVSLKDDTGKWSRPKNLGASINTAGFEISPFLSVDKKRLFFSSDGHQGLGGGDIFYSERLYDSWETWTVPKSVGDTINSKYFDASFSLFGDSVAFLASNRGDNTADIFRVDISIGGQGPTPESIERMIKEAESILSEIRGTDNKATVIFDEDSHFLSEGATTDLLKFVETISKSGNHVQIEIQAFYAERKEAMEKDGLIQKRVEQVRNFLVQNGINGEIIIDLRQSTSKLESPGYVLVIAKQS